MPAGQGGHARPVQHNPLRDGQLITGQNPMSSAAVAAELLAALGLGATRAA